MLLRNCYKVSGSYHKLFRNNLNLNLTLAKMASMLNRVNILWSILIKFINNKVLNTKLLTKWYTSKIYGASAIECCRNQFLRSYPIHLPFSETAFHKVHHGTNRPFSRCRWYLPTFGPRLICFVVYNPLPFTRWCCQNIRVAINDYYNYSWRV